MKVRRKKERKNFNHTIIEKYGQALTEKDIGEIDEGSITPKFELYSNDVERNSNIQDIDDVTCEDFDQYIGAEVLLPKRKFINDWKRGSTEKRFRRKLERKITRKSNA